jgi:hypothetical protein
LELSITFGDFYNVILCDVKYDGKAKGLYRLKHVGAPGSGLAYLSRYNSGWFCHRYLDDSVVYMRDLILTHI